MAKKARKAATNQAHTRLNIYMPDDLNARVEAWRRHPERPIIYPKAAAARELIRKGLDADEKGQRR